MRSSVVRPSLFLAALSLVCIVPQVLAGKADTVGDSQSSEQKRAVHALNRLTFGPRPGDVQQVVAMGVDKWIDLQLHPERISDAALESRLAPFRTLRMSAREMVEEFPDNQIVRQVMDGKRPMPSDPAKRAIVEVEIARIQQRQENRAQRNEAVANTPASTPATDRATTAMAANADGEAAASAKTAEELAAAAAARPDAMPNAPADRSSENGMGAPETVAPSGEMSMASPAEPTTSAGAAASVPMDDPEARHREEQLYADLEVQGLPDLPPDQRYTRVLSMPVEQQLAFADSLRGGKGQEFLTGLDPKQKETLLALNNPGSVGINELIQAKLLRAIYSDRQLEEVMTDFWFNHFNVFANKGADRVLLTSYEQDVIRPRALGKFEDLLVATAKSPAMLFYLDNWLSIGPNSMQALGIPARPGRYGPYRYPGQNPNARPRQGSGLNENYGRELLELHTLSVNGGYSQRDVTEVAKVFTGWTIDKPFAGGDFQFDPRRHEPGPKFVLGHRIKPKGEDEGREVLHMLATSPQTAHFISLKLAQRFVSDDPPPALVDRMAKTFQKKKGDIREVLITLFHSPEFWDESAYRAKVKTPLEFVASAVRATGANVEDAMPLANQINKMGMQLYGAQPPTGYSMKADTWVSSSALLNRMNFAMALTNGKIRGVKVDPVQLAGEPSPPDATVALSTMESKLLAADVSKQTHDSIVAQIGQQKAAPTPQSDNQKSQGKPTDANAIIGLLLGSPEFQRR